MFAKLNETGPGVTKFSFACKPPSASNEGALRGHRPSKHERIVLVRQISEEMEGNAVRLSRRPNAPETRTFRILNRL